MFKGGTQSDNAPRYRPGDDHVESWFLRANHPTLPRAFWLKVTILSKAGAGALYEVWCSVFDGDTSLAIGRKVTAPVEAASFAPASQTMEVAACSFRLDANDGRAEGAIGDISWDMRWSRLPGLLGDPLCLLPTRKLIDARLPKNKLLTPAPSLKFQGTLTRAGETWELDDWLGMQGHNWGDAHSPEYAWGQCHFRDDGGDAFCSVEAASGRIVLAGVTTPLLSLMTVRRGEKTYRFDRLVDLWNQSAQIDFPDWSLRMTGRDGDALLRMRARPERMVCLGYENPNGRISYCLNSKLATASLRVNPVNEDGFACVSAHGGALEFLQPDPHPRFGEVV